MELFGTPLNQVPRPHKPFQVKMWHVGLGIGISILLYKGIEKLFEDVFKGSKNKFMKNPIKLKEEDKTT